MSLRLYLTTDACGYRDTYRCCIWEDEPELKSISTCIAGRWMGGASRRIVVGYILYCPLTGGALAALGFPPPGKMRVIEIGEYEEGE